MAYTKFEPGTCVVLVADVSFPPGLLAEGTTVTVRRVLEPFAGDHPADIYEVEYKGQRLNVYRRQIRLEQRRTARVG